MSYDSIVVPPSFLERMIDHAKKQSPVECCGVLGGRNNVISSVYPLKNDSQCADRYDANPEELFDATRKMRKNGEEMIGIYHSHPDKPADPSIIDQEKNNYPNRFYFIISLRENEPKVNCFKMTDDGRFDGVTIV